MGVDQEGETGDFKLMIWQLQRKSIFITKKLFIREKALVKLNSWSSKNYNWLYHFIFKQAFLGRRSLRGLPCPFEIW
jgi:hypothetical protein